MTTRTAETAEVRVFEGEVADWRDDTGCDRFVLHGTHDGLDVEACVKGLVGRRVRITVEVLDDAPAGISSADDVEGSER